MSAPLYPTMKSSTTGTDPAGSHEFKPWREVGWIFRDGETIAIERRGDETRLRQHLG
ncbi:MAG TPA: hypothetical protein VL961_12570 [Acidimicrobiales bacterium]|nr:hypothetical protein [Acidimicrobiales bacterium]